MSMEPGDFANDRAEAWDTMQVVRFHVGTQQYMLDIMKVKEIINPVEIVPLPNAPAFIEGLIELRGAFLAVADLRKRLGLGPSEITRKSKFVVAILDRQHIGLMVDRVVDVRRIAVSDIKEAPAFARDSVGLDPVTGVVKWDQEVVLLLDLERLLSDHERAALERVSE